MRRLIGRLLLLLAAVVVVEGHLMIGQSLAWFTMIKERAPALGIQDSIESSLSGKNPCEICYLLQSERSRHRENSSIPEATTMAKMIPLRMSPESNVLFPPALTTRILPSSSSVKSQWQGDIPHPPPWMA
ncbi:MAG TPA: hypothetical protein DD438_08145 [Verrucomicrobiales bacterium]|nr:hypothetical protein [Verrucomicrobiales bacterium]